MGLEEFRELGVAVSGVLGDWPISWGFIALELWVFSAVRPLGVLKLRVWRFRLQGFRFDEEQSGVTLWFQIPGRMCYVQIL